MMSILISDRVPVKELPKEAFVIECDAMFGDADGSKIVTLGPFPTGIRGEQFLEEAILFCLEAKQAQSREDVMALPGFENWFPASADMGYDIEVDDTADVDDDRNESTFPEAYKDFIDKETGGVWPMDPFSDWSIPASFNGFKVYFYDSGSNKYTTVIKLTQTLETTLS